MPQVAVQRNPGRNEDVPFIVQVQSTRLDRSIGRVIVDEGDRDRVIQAIDEMTSRA
jgi:hypothetical protein